MVLDVHVFTCTFHLTLFDYNASDFYTQLVPVLTDVWQCLSTGDYGSSTEL